LFRSVVSGPILDTGRADRRPVVFHGNSRGTVLGQRSNGDRRHGAHRQRCGKSGKPTLSCFPFFSIVFVFVFVFMFYPYRFATLCCFRLVIVFTFLSVSFYPGVAVAMGYICFLNVICYSPIQSRCLFYMYWSLPESGQLPWKQCLSDNDSLCITDDRHLDEFNCKSVGIDLRVPDENFYL